MTRKYNKRVKYKNAKICDHVFNINTALHERYQGAFL